MGELYLVEPSIELQAIAMEYQKDYLIHNETEINGSLGFINYNIYSQWLDKVILAHNKETSPIEVPATTYFTIRKSDGKIVGSIQLRHELNDDFSKRGGHIGYGICPSERGKGYGTVQLSLVLDKAREIGLTRVMISCDKDNSASARVAIRNGAKLVWEGYDDEDGDIKIFWIDIN